ncbi:outer membrane transport energization protein ExbD [Hydromonas duriensis]|uniref:Outer membrane transport energization protein ExbD n=2 Tax=Hydromonas duriensis TaxID=1527608 RepID=A0A4R6Y9X4_9BURK|nr:outer membrane transport energization protein ExbD [Hydromonas duriensis]
MADINVTPMVDVMLVLLVFFIMAAPLLTHSVKVELPNEKAQGTAVDKTPVVLSIDAQGQYFIDGHAVKDADLLGSLTALAAKNAETPVHIRADQAVPYAKVAHLLTAAQTSGLSKVSFLTQSGRSNAANSGAVK